MTVSKTEILNCLLMLSSNEPPDPVTEVEWHAERWAQEKTPTFVATTRQIKGRPGVSEIHFYGDADLANGYLGGGIFHSYIPLSSPRGQEIFSTSRLYKEYGCPAATRGFIGVTEFKLGLGKSIEDLKATMRSNGKPLTLKNLPPSAARIQIYFLRPQR